LNPPADDATVVAANLECPSHICWTAVPMIGRPSREEGNMATGDLVARVEVVEKKMTALEELPARVSSLETQILQLRTEMKEEFSAVRQEMRSLNEETKAEMRSLNEQTKAEMRTLEDGLRREMRTFGEGLRREMSELNDQTLTHVRVLHEAVIERIARLDKAWNGSPRKSKRR
jgi:cell division protein FtsB